MENLITPAEAAVIAKRGRPTVYRWIRNGLLSVRRNGIGEVFIDEAELRALLTPVLKTAGAGSAAMQD